MKGYELACVTKWTVAKIKGREDIGRRTGGTAHEAPYPADRKFPGTIYSIVALRDLQGGIGGPPIGARFRVSVMGVDEGPALTESLAIIAGAIDEEFDRSGGAPEDTNAYGTVTDCVRVAPVNFAAKNDAGKLVRHSGYAYDVTVS